MIYLFFFCLRHWRWAHSKPLLNLHVLKGRWHAWLIHSTCRYPQTLALSSSTSLPIAEQTLGEGADYFFIIIFSLPARFAILLEQTQEGPEKRIYTMQGTRTMIKPEQRLAQEPDQPNYLQVSKSTHSPSPDTLPVPQSYKLWVPMSSQTLNSHPSSSLAHPPPLSFRKSPPPHSSLPSDKTPPRLLCGPASPKRPLQQLAVGTYAPGTGNLPRWRSDLRAFVQWGRGHKKRCRCWWMDHASRERWWMR